MKFHGIKSVTIEGVDVYIEDCDIDIEIERESVCISKDVEASANVDITKGVLESGCDIMELVAIARWCKELIEEINEDAAEASAGDAKYGSPKVLNNG